LSDRHHPILVCRNCRYVNKCKPETIKECPIYHVRLSSEKEISVNLENSNDIFLQGEQKSTSDLRGKSDKVSGGSI